MAERPPPLSPEVRALLRGYRAAHAMPEDARARVQERLHDRSRPPNTAPRRSPWLWAGVGAVAAGLLLWGLASISGALQSNAKPDPRSEASMRSTDTQGDTARLVTPPAPESRPVPDTPAPAPAPPLAAPDTGPEPPAPKRGSRAVPRPEPRPDPEPTTPASRLGAENRLIAQTWEHVRTEQYAKAEATLAEHAKAFPAGVLAPERKALEVIVDCLAHPESAVGKADVYARSGRTTLLAKVRSACEER